MGEWFYKLKWVLKYRVSTHSDQNYISHSVITEHTHVKAEYVCTIL